MSDIFEAAKKAINTLVKYQLRPTPNNYAVFFAYYSQSSKGLFKAVDNAIKNEKISEAECLQIYEKFLDDKASERVMAASDELAKEVSTVIKDIGKVEERNKYFTIALSNAKNTLAIDSDAGDIRAVVDSLSEATEKMETDTKDLELKLSRTTREIEALRKELEAAKNEAQLDALTGLYNRKAFNSFLQEKIDEANDVGHPLTAIIGDIDHFKAINDTWGHQTGDQVICFVSSVMQRVAPNNSMVARLGGEEFIMIMPDITLDRAYAIGEKIRTTIENKKLIRRNSGQDLGKITISLGATQYITNEVPNNFIERGDKALYKSKNEGRNRVSVLRYEDVKVA